MNCGVSQIVNKGDSSAISFKVQFSKHTCSEDEVAETKESVSFRKIPTWSLLNQKDSSLIQSNKDRRNYPNWPLGPSNISNSKFLKKRRSYRIESLTLDGTLDLRQKFEVDKTSSPVWPSIPYYETKLQSCLLKSSILLFTSI